MLASEVAVLICGIDTSASTFIGCPYRLVSEKQNVYIQDSILTRGAHQISFLIRRLTVSDERSMRITVMIWAASVPLVDRTGRKSCFAL